KKTLKEIEKVMLKEQEIDVTDISSLSIELEHLSPQYRIEPPEPFTLDQMIKKLEEKKLYFPENNSKKKCIDLLNTLGYYNLKHFINNEFEKDEEKKF
ncbi:Abi family protein, partial [Staphylococcus aureus]